MLAVRCRIFGKITDFFHGPNTCQQAYHSKSTQWELALIRDEEIRETQVFVYLPWSMAGMRDTGPTRSLERNEASTQTCQRSRYRRFLQGKVGLKGHMPSWFVSWNAPKRTGIIPAFVGVLDSNVLVQFSWYSVRLVITFSSTEPMTFHVFNRRTAQNISISLINMPGISVYKWIDYLTNWLYGIWKVCGSPDPRMCKVSVQCF